MSANIKKTLIELGLSETEARIYLSMLELGPESVQNVAKRAEISRTAAYEIISHLQEKGLVSTFEKGKKTVFSAEDPEKLEDYFHGRMERMKIQLGSLDRMLPELRVMKGGVHPRVRFYTGEEGIRALFRDVGAVNTSEILEITNSDVVYNFLDEKLLVELRKIEGFKNLKLKSLGRGVVKNPNPNAEIRELDQALGDFEGNIWIYKNHIAFVNLIGDIEVVIIENKVFAETFTVLFNAAWNCSKTVK
jgi:sugar-specific transcriptional regulator TrmB